MSHSVPLEEMWQMLWPLVSTTRVDVELVRAGLDSIDVRSGFCERLVRSGSISIVIEARVSSVATITVFDGPKALSQSEVEADPTGWFIRKLSVRSGLYGTLAPSCRRMKLPIVADPAVHNLRHRSIQ